ncbi:MAG: PQQ-binding-like beta-propeller repeat protein [Pseudomonadales bacterium]|nr:PQQ-binding-like beta-propeller repeat protein [Pseudomonadales bacterium]
MSRFLPIGLAAVAVLASPALHADGAATFGAHCARCHAPVEMVRRLVGDWRGRSAAELHRVTRESMPAEMPGSLSDRDYLDVVAYMLDLADVVRPDGALEAAQLAAISVVPVVRSEAGPPDVPWRNFGGELNANRYAPLDEIDRDNVADLEIAWRWSAANFGPSPEIRNVSMPIMRDGKLFLGAGATRNVVALDAATGQMLWLWRPREGERFEQAARKDSGKGVSFWAGADGRRRVIVVTPGYHLVSLNADTGLPDPEFGAGGWVDLTEGLRRAPDRELDVGLTAPPLVVGDVIVVGSAHRVSFRPPSMANVKGDVRGFDARTGELLWTFHTIPEPGEEGYETWFEDSALYTGNAGVWAPMSADPELGLVYLPVESGTGDQYGGDRPGSNLFANSLVALDVRTGERRWHFQHTHHDIWDWDTPAAPILADLPDGRRVVALNTKQAMTFVFDRETGEPIWPIEERPVPASDVPGEWTSPTQPFPLRPAPFDRQGVSRADLIDYTPEIRAAVDALLETVRLGPMYQPPSLADAADGTRGTLSLPSSVGGANWEGGAYDPGTGLLFVPSMTRIVQLQLVHDPDASDVRFISGRPSSPSVFDIPLAKPPWGRITAIDLATGDHRWMIANGDTPRSIAENPALAGVELPSTGKPTRAGVVVTDTLLFAGEGFGGDPVFRAHDKETGEIVAEIALPATQAGPPSTYRVKGRQFVVMTVGDREHPAELVALALPER